MIFAGDSSVPQGIEVFTPFSNDLAKMPRDLGWIRMVARLAPGATLASAQAELSAIAGRLSAEFPEYRTVGLELTAVPAPRRRRAGRAAAASRALRRRGARAC